MGYKRHDPSRPCGTPGTKFETQIEGNTISLINVLPFPVFNNITEEQKEKLSTEFHHAIIPAMEEVYKLFWNEYFAGKRLEGDSYKLPKAWSDLFKNYQSKIYGEP